MRRREDLTIADLATERGARHRCIYGLPSNKGLSPLAGASRLAMRWRCWLFC